MRWDKILEFAVFIVVVCSLVVSVAILSALSIIAETWDWIVEKLCPFAWFVALFRITAVLLLLVISLRACFQ